ncbi:DNA gyrase inhibitor YacG [Neisseria iguanae]|uniref:DNA gyrase inhibitor YacG n=1 Tax=Neisseria iguanae TaxID=90242 RepID=A0A2P7TYA1_9NEIS|nr:DNA gyrase inhibitor YacG [Neisseria iguanae]PSJ79671.1 DNA gyrase inhibitor YacG [Neisseria iguanae]
MHEHTTIVKCPTCQTPVIWSNESQYRPFCSQRCKLIDLGGWAEEHYSVAAVEDDALSDILK